jgi:uncharacterized protein (DUF58 family)
MSPYRFIPGKRLALYVALGMPLLFFGGSGRLGALLLDAWLCAAALLEARSLARRAPHVSREIDARFLLGVTNTVHLKLQNASAAAISGSLRDDYPDGFTAAQPEHALSLPAYAHRELLYEVWPPRRGLYEFGDLHLRLDGRFGLGSALVTLPARAQVRVYPNLRGPRRYELAARLGALHSVGVRNVRRGGGGGEFEQLREYVPGDPFRDLDWKATAKRLRPITRVHGQEHSQTVLVALDAGRMMATQQGELTKLDHAIHAALLLCFVALRSGDKVGLIVFAEQVQRFVPPGRGNAQYRRILDALYAVEASPLYVDFRRLSEFVRRRVPRRCLLLLFSDLLDESQAMPPAAEAPRLRGKHLPVCVTMNDPVASALASAPAQTESDVYQRAAAADILADREAVKTHLQKAGVGLLEAPAGELAIATVNRYLEIKTRHAL